MSSAHVGVDIGGTFTDVLRRGPDGEIRIEKRLSTPGDYSQAIVAALLALSEGDDLAGIGVLAHATTIATNAVLEATGGRVGLITTGGFRDVLELGRLQRSDLYDLMWEKWPPLVPRRQRAEVTERIASDGAVLTALDLDSVARAVDQLMSQDVDALAICLINSYVNPAHEQSVAQVARERAPGLHVVTSVDLLREAGEFERTSTAVVNAYLLPVVASYLATFSERVRSHGARVTPSIMQSSGGMISIDAAGQMPVRMIESGPAAGVRAAAALAEACGIRQAISFDMGGTTAKACMVEDFRPSISDEYWVGSGLNREGSRLLRGRGYAIRVPTMDIAEVSSGGGSIAWIDAGGALKVGPRSAGASPGPACYGLGGSEPTFTDACVVLGILGRDAIGVDELAIDPELAEQAIRTRIAEPLQISVTDAARAIFEVAISNLSRAVRAVTTDVGKDPADFALIAFGGGGGMVAGPLARELGIEHVIVPPLPGVFSTVGLLTAPFRRDAVQGVFRPLSTATVGELGELGEAMERQLLVEMRDEGHGGEREVVRRRRIDLRYRGQATSVATEWQRDDWGDAERAHRVLQAAFMRDYERLHRHLRDVDEIEVAAIHVTVEAATDVLRYEDLIAGRIAAEADARTVARPLVDLATGDETTATVTTSRSAAADHQGDGDLVVDEPDATIFIPAGCAVDVDDFGAVHLRPLVRQAEPLGHDVTDASSVEIFNNWLGAVNDELTALIARTAQSEIAKDTLDFATAICDRSGRVVSQGLTVVLHAGSVPKAIDLLLELYGDDLHPGDAFLSNDPYLAGGSHLPDIYVIRPIFVAGEHVAFVGTVCHVADMGGRVPGGNASDSEEIYQEGLRLPPVRIVSGDEIVPELERILRANVRVPDKVLGDLHALIGACSLADRRIHELVRARGSDYLLSHMDALLMHARRVFEERIRAFPAGRFSFSDVIDEDGMGNGPVTIRAQVERHGDRLRVSFAGSDPQAPGATNSPLCFTRSAAYYAAKAVLGADIPDNSGYFELVDVDAPPGTVVNPTEPGATGAKGVAAFRIVDALFGAFAQAMPERVPAAGDGGGTIVAFGGRDAGRAFVLVDIVMSAWGGRPAKDGIDGISAAASNGRNTPIEVIEASYPVRVETYEFIPDTGGAGRFRGGLATHRTYRYLGSERAVLQVRSDRRPTRPWGLLGGGQGAASDNSLVQGDSAVQLPTKFTIPIQPGALYEHRTASGGGYGDPLEREAALVLEDVRDGKVSIERAAADYGVAIDADLTIDEAATAVLRAGEDPAHPETMSRSGARR